MHFLFSNIYPTAPVFTFLLCSSCGLFPRLLFSNDLFHSVGRSATRSCVFLARLAVIILSSAFWGLCLKWMQQSRSGGGLATVQAVMHGVFRGNLMSPKGHKMGRWMLCWLSAERSVMTAGNEVCTVCVCQIKHVCSSVSEWTCLSLHLHSFSRLSERNTRKTLERRVYWIRNTSTSVVRACAYTLLSFCTSAAVGLQFKNNNKSLGTSCQRAAGAAAGWACLMKT